MRNASAWWIRIPFFFFLIFGLMEFCIDSGDRPAIIAFPLTNLFLLLVLLILIAIELILAAIENVMFQTLSEEAKSRYLAAKHGKREWAWGKRVYSKLVGTKPLEQEEEIILDHNYDGIRELDNTLPPWWVYMFYLTIIFGLVYMARFHLFGGYTQQEEYESEVAAAREAIDTYKKTARDLVDINTVQLLTGESDLRAGETIFITNCAVCHKVDGGGGIGPNLTDDYWILGGGIKNVFHTISEGGRPGKGMVSWKANLKPVEMAQVASYVVSLRGSSPTEPKAPEGDRWEDPNVPAGEGHHEDTDSTSLKDIDQAATVQ